MSGTPLNEFENAAFPPRWKYSKKRGSAGRTPSIWDLNLRLSYEIPRLWSTGIRARFFLDLLHIRDSQEVKPLRIDENKDNTTYGEVILYQKPITARLGLEFYF
jgi:hypothetical protein